MKTRKYSARALVVLVMAVLTLCLLPSVPVMAASTPPLYFANGPWKIVVATYTNVDMLLLTIRTAAGGIVASAIITVLAARHKIEKMISTVRRRLFGHHPGPPFFIVLFSSLVKALEGIVTYFVAYFVDTLTCYNCMKVGDGYFMNDSPFSLGAMTNVYISG